MSCWIIEAIRESRWKVKSEVKREDRYWKCRLHPDFSGFLYSLCVESFQLGFVMVIRDKEVERFYDSGRQGFLRHLR